MLGCRPHVWWWWDGKNSVWKLLSLPSTLFVTNSFPWFNIWDLKNLFHRPYFWLILQVILFNRPCQKWLMREKSNGFQLHYSHESPAPELTLGGITAELERSHSVEPVLTEVWHPSPSGTACHWTVEDLPDLWNYLENNCFSQYTRDVLFPLHWTN